MIHRVTHISNTLILSLFLLSSCYYSRTNDSEITLTPPSETVYYEPLATWLKPIPQTKSDISDKGYITAIAHPTSIEELSELERNPDIIVSYIPWGYEPLPNYSPEELLSKSLDRTNYSLVEGPLFIPSSPCVIGDSINRPASIPPVYIYWSEGKQLNTTIRVENLRKEQNTHTRETKSSLSAKGRLLFHDETSNANLPIKNMLIRICDGGVPETSYTDSLGYFSVPSWAFDHHTNISIQMYSDVFSVREENWGFPRLRSLGSIEDLWEDEEDVPDLILTSDPELILYMSAQYYFFDNSPLLSSLSLINEVYPIVRFYLTDDGSFMGTHAVSYSAVNGSNADIYLSCAYNNYFRRESLIMGEVLHSLGHLTHEVNTTPNNYYLTAHWLKESYACFFGWYSVLDHYSDILDTVSIGMFSEQGNQGWDGSTGNLYWAPLFVDLYDDLNQKNGGSYVKDDVSFIPVHTISTIALRNKTFSACSSDIRSMSVVYDCVSQVDTLLNYYSPLYNLL